MMDPETKSEWMAALRSGEYQQGTQHLESNGLFCCLGVLCRVKKFSLTKHREDQCLTDDELKKVGMSEWQMNHLICLNDGTKSKQTLEWAGLPTDPTKGDWDQPEASLTFNQIADLIERKL